MGATAKAIWLIEQHHAAPLTLEALAHAVGLSRYHFCRVFAAETGLPPMRYSRARRLSEAAKALNLGLSVTDAAFAAGFESPEGFSRAFRDEFKAPPSAIRAGPGLCSLTLTKPHAQEDNMTATLPSPRFETRGPFLVTGLRASYDRMNVAGVPSLWARFAPHIGTFPMADPGITYGVYTFEPAAERLDYLAGVEPKTAGDAPQDLETAHVPGGRYAVFTHEGHVSDIRKSMTAIFENWFPGSGETSAETPAFERYDGRFDPATGEGAVEIWIPLR